MEIETYLTKIAFELHQAESHLALIRQKLAELEQAGIYPALPTERWKDDREFVNRLAIGDVFQSGVEIDDIHRGPVGRAAGNEAAANPFFGVDPKLPFLGWVVWGLMERTTTSEPTGTGGFKTTGIRGHKRGDRKTGANVVNEAHK